MSCFDIHNIKKCDLSLKSQRFQQVQDLIAELKAKTSSARFEGWIQSVAHIKRIDQTIDWQHYVDDRPLHLEFVFLDEEHREMSIHVHWNDSEWILSQIQKKEGSGYFVTEKSFLIIEPGLHPKSRNDRIQYEIYWKAYTLEQVRDYPLLDYTPIQPYCSRMVSSFNHANGRV